MPAGNQIFAKKYFPKRKQKVKTFSLRFFCGIFDKGF
jgi:hypothetical protein